MRRWWERWRRLARTLKREISTVYFVLRHPDTPWYARMLAGIVVAYAFSPIDLIPDPVPLIGYLDDLVLVPLGMVLVLQLIPPGVLVECRARAATEPIAGRWGGWFAAGVIVVLWVLVAWIALRFLLDRVGE